MMAYSNQEKENLGGHNRSNAKQDPNRFVMQQQQKDKRVQANSDILNATFVVNMRDWEPSTCMNEEARLQDEDGIFE